MNIRKSLVTLMGTSLMVLVANTAFAYFHWNVTTTDGGETWNANVNGDMEHRLSGCTVGTYDTKKEAKKAAKAAAKAANESGELECPAEPPEQE